MERVAVALPDRRGPGLLLDASALLEQLDLAPRLEFDRRS